MRETLTRWGLLPPNSPREAVGALGLDVRKVEVGGHDPTDVILHYLGRHPADLIVLATHQRSGLARWLYREVAAPLVRQSALAALFVPPGVDGFVEFTTGHVRLQRILMPIDQHPHPRDVIAALRGKLFYRLVQQAVAVDPAPYTSLVKHVQAGRPRRRRSHNI